MTSTETSQMNKRFEGFRNTPFLWEGLLEGLKMYQAKVLPITDYPKIGSTSHIRLGKLIEQFVLFEMEKNESVQVLKSNIQIFHDQITIGELDCLIKQLDEIIHVEIVYKFYLYDPSISTELDRWVGPNRKDSLVFKLNKLKEKQLPLLYHPETAQLLNQLNLNVTDIIQRLYFKAQLFVPFEALGSPLPLINEHCVKGFYLRQEELASFANDTFYIPSKLDWLVEPNLEVNWMSIQDFEHSISELLSTQKSPLCWMKSVDDKMQKFFVVWWP